MTYRSDTDALEARLEVLEKDLTDRTRERDEVARLLAEARNTDAARRWLEDAPRRRRRRKILFGVLASAVLIAAAIMTLVRMHRDARLERNEQVLHQFEQFADEACACKDKACADKVTERVSKWGQEMAKDHDYLDEKPDPEMVKRFEPVAERFSKCLTAAMSLETPAEKPPTSPP